MNSVSCRYAGRWIIQPIIGKNTGIMLPTRHMPIRIISSYHMMMQGALQTRYTFLIFLTFSVSISVPSVSRRIGNR
jgi:hypothetical protein